jgi:hypothetical protein
MSVRKGTWTNASWQEGWIVVASISAAYVIIDTFDAYHATVRVELRHGTHTADSARCGRGLWIKTADRNG